MVEALEPVQDVYYVGSMLGADEWLMCKETKRLAAAVGMAMKATDLEGALEAGKLGVERAQGLGPTCMVVVREMS